MKFNSLIVVVCGLCVATGALAAGGADTDAPSWSATAEDPAVKSARAALAAGDYASAQTMLKVALAGSPGNADLNNLYAYSMRKGANPDMTTVFKYYGEALRILMVNDPAKAKEHLAALDKLCFFGCPEYAELKKAIAEYELKTKK